MAAPLTMSSRPTCVTHLSVVCPYLATPIIGLTNVPMWHAATSLFLPPHVLSPPSSLVLTPSTHSCSSTNSLMSWLDFYPPLAPWINVPVFFSSLCLYVKFYYCVRGAHICVWWLWTLCSTTRPILPPPHSRVTSGWLGKTWITPSSRTRLQ
jgi:hypothetical protein